MNKEHITTIERLDEIHLQFIIEYEGKFKGQWHSGASSTSFVEWLKGRIRNSSSFKKEIDEILDF